MLHEEQALDSPALEMHSLTWRLGYVDPHDETVPLSRLLDMARRHRLTIYADHRQDQLKDSPFEGALVLRLGDFGRKTSERPKGMLTSAASMSTGSCDRYGII